MNAILIGAIYELEIARSGLSTIPLHPSLDPQFQMTPACGGGMGLSRRRGFLDQPEVSELAEDVSGS